MILDLWVLWCGLRVFAFSFGGLLGVPLRYLVCFFGFYCELLAEILTWWF